MVRSVSIEISGSSSCESSPIITHDGEENHDIIRVTATLPTVVHSDNAILATASLLDLVDGFDAPVVERVKISNISFMDGDVEGLGAFLVLHAPSVRHLSLANISDYRRVPHSSTSDNKALAALVLAFQTASLESIDLSRNNLGHEIWSILNSHHSCVKKVLLDDVLLDNQSMASLAKSSRFVAAVEHFHLVMRQPLGPSGVEASNKLLHQFTRLRTLRWANRSLDASLSTMRASGSLLPWPGISRMAERNRTTLETLVLEGSETTESDVILISATLGLLSRLSTLKLRRLGIADHALGMIVAVLIQKLRPLTCIDLSYNSIQPGGAFALMEILSNTRLAQSLRYLGLENNQLDRPSLSKLIKTAALRVSPEFELRCDNNGPDTGLLAYDFAMSSATTEADRDKAVRELARVKSQLKEAQYHLREISAAQTTILADYHKLKKENLAIKAERETLIQAFEILGSTKQVEAQARLLSRVSQIEDCLFGEASRGSGSARSVTETLSMTGDETSRSRSTSYDESPMAPKGGRRRPLPRSRSNDSMVPLSGDRRQRELKGSMDAAHHGSVTTAATLASSRSTLFSASANSFDDLTGSTTTFALTPSPRRRLPVRVMSERWGRPGSMSISLPPERVPRSPSLHSSQHSFRFGDSNRSLKCDIAEEEEDEASLDPNEMVPRDREHSVSRPDCQLQS